MPVIAAALAFLLLQQLPTSAGTPGGEKWAKVYTTPGEIGWRHPVGVALAPNARCVAIGHAGIVTVFDMSGAALWSWNFAKASRYIQPADLAVASSCDAVAIVGSSEYKYTWLARRRGGARALKTPSTPLSAAFDHRGEHLAIGTGGSDVHLFTVAGELKWKTTLEHWCCVVNGLAFSDDDRFVLLTGWGIGVLRADGGIVWTGQDNEMAASRDLRTFVSWAQPPHGPGIGVTVVRDERGDMVWPGYKYTSTVGALVSRDGTRIAAWVNENQQPTEEDGYKDDHPRALQVMSRQGEVLSTIPAPRGELLAFSPRADRLLLKAPDRIVEVDTAGRISFLVLLNPNEFSQVLVAEDYSGLLVAQGQQNTRIQWFDLRPKR
jgi:hypothetical protein